MESADLIFFSPTGTTSAICRSVKKGLGAVSGMSYDLTSPSILFDFKLYDSVAVIGVPVYAGRVPQVCIDRMRFIQADNIPTVLIALYGNRAFEDALVELADLVTDKGFKVVAAAAFIGEHSYATADAPIAKGRPDEQDLRQAEAFGKEVREKLDRGEFSLPMIEGGRPYREGVVLGGIAPQTRDDVCTLCGQCEQACPMGIIRQKERVCTDASTCIMCCACVKVCSAGARTFSHPQIEERRALLLQHCSLPKQPTIFI